MGTHSDLISLNTHPRPQEKASRPKKNESDKPSTRTAPPIKIKHEKITHSKSKPVKGSPLDVVSLQTIMQKLFAVRGPSIGPTVRITEAEHKIIQDFMQKELFLKGIDISSHGPGSMSKLFRYALIYMIHVYGKEFSKAAHKAFSSNTNDFSL